MGLIHPFILLNPGADTFLPFLEWNQDMDTILTIYPALSPSYHVFTTWAGLIGLIGKHFGIPCPILALICPNLSLICPAFTGYNLMCLFSLLARWLGQGFDISIYPTKSRYGHIPIIFGHIFYHLSYFEPNLSCLYNLVLFWYLFVLL